MSFADCFTKDNWTELETTIYSTSAADVEKALSKDSLSVQDFCALISPAARSYLEPMAVKSQQRTLRRFGKTMQLYAPLYLSNECSNICTYCGFSYGNGIKRITLSDDEIIREARAVRDMGFEHVLLVTGESNRTVGVDYLENAMHLVRPYFSNISLEVQPLEADEYRRLRGSGLHAVLVYQETYNRESYKEHHPKGKKSNFVYRLETPERLGKAGVHKIGLGALLGLSDWRVDAAALAGHLSYLERKFWQQRFSISFPRLRPAEGVIDSASALEERELVQLICAFRLFNETVELSLSTRESAYFRDNMIPLGVTSMSAGSKTDPGGYAVHRKALKQFEVDDNRSPAEVVAALKLAGYDPVWKDWDMSFDEGAYAGSL